MNLQKKETLRKKEAQFFMQIKCKIFSFAISGFFWWPMAYFGERITYKMKWAEFTIWHANMKKKKKQEYIESSNREFNLSRDHIIIIIINIYLFLSLTVFYSSSPVCFSKTQKTLNHSAHLNRPEMMVMTSMEHVSAQMM